MIICFTQCFIIGKLFIIDSIFNINKLHLPLLINIDIINSGKIFLYILSYYPGKIVESYDFFFKYCTKKYE